MRVILWLAYLMQPLLVGAQEVPLATQQQIEALAESISPDEDDWEQLRKEPLQLNTASYNELKQFGLLSEEHITSLISYRNLLGPFISVYELQAIPGWDLISIRKVLPFISLGNNFSLNADLASRISEGEHRLLLRGSGKFNLDQAATFEGNNHSILFRYKYVYKNLLQFGLTGDKDSGERFFSGAQRYGFDFYSIHLFSRRIGIFKSIAVGDFTVNFGQGLIHWQSLSFRKSGDPMLIKRESAVLKPYSSAGEFNFHRGVGVTIQKGKIESTAFVSLKKADATVDEDENGRKFFSSLRQTGYHRSATEIASRRNLQQFTTGLNTVYRRRQLQLGLNAVYDRFSLPLKKDAEPYQLFAMKGQEWYNVSTDYSYTYKNMHLFGEWALDKNYHAALINGCLISAGHGLDISLVHRSIASDYQAVNGSAFTENSKPVNEKGLYVGARFSARSFWRIDVYADVFRFPWLKYQVDALSNGRDYLLQLNFTPNKQSEICMRYRNSNKLLNMSVGLSPMGRVEKIFRQDWRIHITHRINNNISWQTRLDLSWFRQGFSEWHTGFLAYMDWHVDKVIKGVTARMRMQLFQINNYGSRIYSYENSLSGFSAPVFSGNGMYYYFNIKYKWKNKMAISARWNQFLRESERIDFDIENQRNTYQIQWQIEYFL